jgi:hypothetical protein
MLPTVSFYDDPLFEAYEICNKPADLLLAPEFKPIELLGFQALPQDPFRVGHVPSQILGNFCQVDGHSGFPLSLTLSHQGERESRSLYFSPSPLCGRGLGRGESRKGEKGTLPLFLFLPSHRSMENGSLTATPRSRDTSLIIN